MLQRKLVGLLLSASLWSSSAAAQERSQPVVEITYEKALALAREQAPKLKTARARAHEAERGIDAAKVWRFNPELSGDVGPRFRSDGTTMDWSVQARQWLEVGGQRGDRVNAARAGAEAGAARSEDARRGVVRDVSLAFIAALYWERRVALAEENVKIAQAISRVATRRHEVGEIGGLEQSVAELAVVQARTNADQAEASLTQAEGRLKALLGIEASSELACRGDLRQLGIDDGAPSDVADRTRPDVADRPDLRALEADIQQARAQAELGRAERVPNLALGAGYFRRESEDVVRGLLTVTLPVFDRGQGTTATAEARQQRLHAELDATKSAATSEAHATLTMARRLRAAARRFEQEGLETLERAEHLAVTSYEAGAIPLGELLAVRRKLVRAKLDYAELLLDAAVAHTQFAASTGALQ